MATFRLPGAAVELRVPWENWPVTTFLRKRTRRCIHVFEETVIDALRTVHCIRLLICMHEGSFESDPDMALAEMVLHKDLFR